MCNGVVVKVLDSQFRGRRFKTAEWVQGQHSLLFFQDQLNGCQLQLQLSLCSGFVVLRQLNPIHEKGL